MKAGRYDFANDAESSQYWQQKRGDINKQLADYLAQRQEYVNKTSSEAEAELKREQLERDTDWHQGVMQGAQMGATVSKGNPYGAIIGAIIGGGIGFGKSVQARKRAGASGGQAFWKTLTDFFPNESSSTQAQATASTLGPLLQARSQQAPTQTMQLQTPGTQGGGSSPYSPGALQMDPELMRRFGGRGPSYTG